MTLNKLIKQLMALADLGFGDTDVNILCCDDNPINGECAPVKGAYVISGHPDKGVDGVYIDGTVC